MSSLANHLNEKYYCIVKLKKYENLMENPTFEKFM